MEKKVNAVEHTSAVAKNETKQNKSCPKLNRSHWSKGTQQHLCGSNAWTKWMWWLHWPYFSGGLWQLSLTHLAVDLSPQHAHVSKLKSICTCIAALTHPGLIGAAAHVQQIRTGTVTTSGDGHFFTRADGNLVTPANATPMLLLCRGCGPFLPTPSPSLPARPGLV